MGATCMPTGTGDARIATATPPHSRAARCAWIKASWPAGTTALTRFLHNHYLADDLVAPVTAMLAAQVTTSPQFKEHCAGCHGTAADFARKALVLRGSVLTGKASGKPVADYLATHGGLPAAEVPAMVKSLQRVLQEVGG